MTSVDFGQASSFITGKYPTYKVAPKNNDTNPGVYDVKVKIQDDNPLP